MTFGRRLIVVAVAAAVLAAACSSSRPLDTSTAGGGPHLGTATTAPGPASSPTTTTCPPYQPALPAPLDCEAYDAADDEVVVGSMLAGDGVPVSARSRSSRASVLAIGDSILAEAHGYLVPLADGHGLEVTVRAVGGTAPCDWVERLDTLLAAVEPDLVLFSFSGNAYTPCMAGGPPGTESYYRAYSTAVAELNELASAAGSEVWWMEVPPFRDTDAERYRTQLNDLYRDSPHTAGIVPTRDLFESASGDFATELGCWFPWEQCPSVRVRADDGIHLDNARSPYGALRYAVSILAFADCWADDGPGQT